MAQRKEGTVIVGVFCILFGGGCCYLFTNLLIVKTIPQLRAARRGRSTQGRVVAIRTRHVKGDGQLTRELDVRTADIHFRTADGQSVTYPQMLEMGLECRRGDTVTVHYDPADAAKTATVDAPYDLTTSIMMQSGLGLFFGLVFVGGVLMASGVIGTS